MHALVALQLFYGAANHVAQHRIGSNKMPAPAARLCTTGTTGLANFFFLYVDVK